MSEPKEEREKTADFSDLKINANSSGTLAVERFKMAMALTADEKETAELRKRLVEDI